MEQLREPICRLILIHGTWASSTKWIEKDSFFASQVSKFIGYPVEIIPFNWSGKNSFNARKMASFDLARLIGEMKDDCYTFMIGHSHGGNIILQTLNQQSVHSAVQGSIFLGTPFLNVRKRRISKFAGTATAISVGILLYIITIILMFLLVSSFGLLPDTRSIISDGIIKIITIIIMATCAYFVIYIVEKWSSWAFKKSEEYQLPNLSKLNSLVVRSAGDEASALLTSLTLGNIVATSIWTLISWTIQKIFMGFQWLKKKLWDENLFTRIALIIIGLALFIILARWKASFYVWSIGEGDFPTYHVFNQILNYIYGIFLLPLIVLVGLLGISAILSSIVLILLMIPYGIDLMPTAGLIEVTVETNPAGESDSFTSFVDDENIVTNKNSWIPFSHSAIYNRKDCIYAIGKWIRKNIH